MASDAIYHHLIPQTYMKPWCFGEKTIWVYDKSLQEWQERNIEKICGIKYYHSIRAGSIYTTPKALNEIWGFLTPYHISLDGVPLDTLEKLNEKYSSFDSWEIYYPKGAKVNKADRNKIKSAIEQAKFNDIEEQWSVQFENGWADLIADINQALIDIHGKKPIALTEEAASILMRYFVMFNWRSFSGNEQFNETLQAVDSIIQLSSISIPETERQLSLCGTALDEMRHNLLIKQFDDYQSGKGLLFEHQKFLQKNCTFVFHLAPQGHSFITSDNPCFSFTRADGLIEPFLVALPQLAFSLVKKDPNSPYNYTICELSESELHKYNAQIFSHSVNLILNNRQIDISSLQ